MTSTPVQQSSDGPIASVDPELWAAMVAERERQIWKIELIASENYASRAVLEANGSWLNNKYAEGQPGARYYGGCEFVDVAERLAEDRALELFPGAEFVNVQPHSGAQANIAAYLAVLDHGDSILGMSLAHGGHLTHGHPINFSGRFFDVHGYGVSRSRRSHRLRRAGARRPTMSGPSSSWLEPVPIPASSISSAWRRSPTGWTPCSSSTWPTSRDSSLPACIPVRSRTPTS